MAITHYDDAKGAWNLRYLIIYVRQTPDEPFEKWVPIRCCDVSGWDPVNRVWKDTVNSVELAPFTQDGFLMVRLRPIFEALGIREDAMDYQEIDPVKENPWWSDNYVYIRDDRPMNEGGTGCYVSIEKNSDKVLMFESGKMNSPMGGFLPTPSFIYEIKSGPNQGGYTFIPLNALLTTFKKQDNRLNPSDNLSWFRNIDIEWCEADRYDESGKVIYPEGMNTEDVDKEWISENNTDPTSKAGWNTSTAKFKLGPKIIITKDASKTSEPEESQDGGE